MDKQSIVKVFVIAILIVYLIKVSLAILLREILIRMEEKGRKREEKRRQYFAEKRRQREERWYKKPPNSHDV
ncbi:hypothetical protein SAMN02745221_01294 [Thermosyntropha lipolytica DSM 11003]|uniref:Uncharacterized protein n=1 Tax=Thermosyntropha lipolytica DSM 11003 TaxID=1123382 RepID=A0A1M5NUJ0_9FIRM|nr:hypothetical protein [Thermosyntropha lipolytica]SHG92849.1 hypothetical protein SAMN02745221_01294 [Thermosyntropha lipolytica DSM 11003]